MPEHHPHGDNTPDLINFGSDELTMAVYCDGPEALKDQEFPLGDRIRAMCRVTTPPDVYDTLADETESILFTREWYRGMTAGCELRILHMEAIIRDLHALAVTWRKTATSSRYDDEPRAASVYKSVAAQTESVINAARTPIMQANPLETEVRNRIMERTARELDNAGAIDKNRPADAGPWVNAPLSVVIALLLGEGDMRQWVKDSTAP